MTNGQLRQLTLELDPEADPIAGTVRDNRGETVQFSGWLGLAAALRGALSDQQPLPAPEQQPPRNH